MSASGRCRVCGEVKPETSLQNITPTVLVNIRKCYGCDLSGDIPDVHPTKCCQACRRAVSRYVNIKEKRGGHKGNIPPLASFNTDASNTSTALREGDSVSGRCSPVNEDADNSLSSKKLQQASNTSTAFCNWEVDSDGDSDTNDCCPVNEDDESNQSIHMRLESDSLPDNEVHQQSKKVRICYSQSVSTQTDSAILDLSDLDNIDLTHLAPEALHKLSYALGKSQRANIRADCLGLSRGRDIQSLLTINLNVYLSERNRVVVGFLLGVADAPIDYTHRNEQQVLEQNEQQNLYTLCKTVESVLNLSVFRCLMPLHFRDSLLIYSITGSRLALSILGSSTAHGSYTSVKKFLSNLGNESDANGLPGDLIYTFDNNQIMHRSWNVSVESKFRCHIVTMIVQFQVNSIGEYQWNAAMKPGLWKMNISPNVHKIRLIDQERNVKVTHYDEHLYPYLLKIITEVATEQKEKIIDGECCYKDEVDDKVEKEEHAKYNKHCYGCGSDEVPKGKIKCPFCKTNLKQAELKAMGLTDKGTWEEKKSKPQKLQPQQFKVSFNETCDNVYKVVYRSQNTDKCDQPRTEFSVSAPVFVNPCSYEACCVVLRNIGHTAGVTRYGGDRQFAYVCCDGSPYVLCARIILCTFLCDLCGESVTGKEEKQKHEMSHNSRNEDDCSMNLEFDWVLMIPGPGHVEMNMIKGFVELTWEIFWRPLVQLLNFKSENALRAAKRVSDHHKGWQLATVAREALVKELVVPWVREELTHDKKPNLSPDAFFKFVMHAQDKTYALVADLVLEILDAIFMYRKGIREEKPNLAYAARGKVAKLWAGRRHPSYREIEMTDSIQLAQMPEELRTQVMKCWSLNTSGKWGTSEGPDFRLEEINKCTQAWIPKVPTGQDWTNVCLNYDSLSKLRDCTIKQLGVKDPKDGGQHRQRNMTTEIDAFRVLLRKSKYLLSPQDLHGVYSLEGVRLSDSLLNFCKVARDNRARYFDAFLASSEARSERRSNVPFTESPVFVTTGEEEEHNKVSKRTVAELKALIGQSICRVTDPAAKEAFESALSGTLKCPEEGTSTSRVSIKKIRLVKADYVELYNELEEYLDEQIDIDSGQISEAEDDD